MCPASRIRWERATGSLFVKTIFGAPPGRQTFALSSSPGPWTYARRVAVRWFERPGSADPASAGGRPPREPLSARTKVIAGIVAALVCGGGGLAIANQSSAPARATDLSRVHCYSRISTDFSDHFPGITVDGALSGGSEPGRDPVGACSGVWQEGLLGTGASTPALVACVLPSGVFGVFPGRAGTCQSVKLPAAG